MGTWVVWVPAIASAAQAIFSVVAIIAAGWIAKSERIATRKLVTEQRAVEDSRMAAADLITARDHAIRILPQLERWTKEADSWRTGLSCPASVFPMEWGKRDAAGEPWLALDLPIVLRQMEGRYREFGPVANLIQQTVVAYLALQLRRDSLFNTVDGIERNLGNSGDTFQHVAPFVRQYCEHVQASVAAIKGLINWDG